MIHKNVINEVIINEWLPFLVKIKFRPCTQTDSCGWGGGGGGGIAVNLTHLPINCP